MKKILTVLALFTFLLIGIQLGSDVSYSKNKVVEEAKDQFESEITEDGNEYEPVVLEPNDSIINDVAKGIDKIINKVIDKFKSLI